MNGTQRTNGKREQAGAQDAACCSPDECMTLIGAQDVAAEVKLLSALADETRLGIVSLLASHDEPLCVCDIIPQFSLAQPTISHHLKVLREARLVRWEKRGLWVYYSLDRETLGGLASYLDGLLPIHKARFLVPQR
jgi:ArsR family transcriptional regulator